MSAAGASILQATTPHQWCAQAVREWRTLLVDHANCEKKAASTALALMFAYPEDRPLSLAMARLAREELRHFEQVQRLMQRLDVPTQRLPPGRYAGALRAQLAAHEPQRKSDLMLSGALIEARSCERFEAVAPLLHEPLGEFYAALAESERRHALLYLELAEAAAGSEVARQGLHARLAVLAGVEAQLIQSPDAQFRFHSGVPVEAAVEAAPAGIG